MAEGEIDYIEAQKHFNRAIQLCPEDATYLTAAGSMAQTMGLYDDAIQHHQAALVLRQRSSGEAHFDVADSYNNLGNSLV